MRNRESGSMSNEWRAKMVVLGHGVRERSNIFGKFRERKDWECLRRVGRSVWEWGFRAKVFFWVWSCEKMLNKMLFWLIFIYLRIWVIFWEEHKEHKHVLPKN